LEQAVAAFRAALAVRSRDLVPFDWAITQSNLGAALLRLAERDSGTARLEEAVATYHLALEELGRNRDPLGPLPLLWAGMQNNLGVALLWLGQSEDETAQFEDAIAAFRAALTVRRRDREPRDWAATQDNLGTALLWLGQSEHETAQFEDAIAAFRAALTVRRRDRMPLAWAATKNNLGDALRVLGEGESGTARLKQAVATLRAALEERTRERVPLDWAATQKNLGIALSRLGERENGTARLEEASAAFEACLTIAETAWPAERVQQVRSLRDKTRAEVARRLAMK
jgi:tetratricopeptide (TPR) repeat protein